MYSLDQYFLMILVSFAVSMLWAPALIKFLYQMRITRATGEDDRDLSFVVSDRALKVGTPIMGGLLVILTTGVITAIFNMNGNTIVPITVLLISAALGGIDDVLNIFGRKRLIRPISKHILLAKVHKSFFHRIFLWLTLPWNVYKNFWYTLGSYPGAGIHAGEKILVQIAASLVVVWWIYVKLGWDQIWVPFIDPIQLGWLMPVFIVFTVISMANAVNISDGMDGLSSGLLLISYTVFMVMALLLGNYPVAMLCATVVGSLMAYLYFNIKPARFEMGDVGSLALGTMLATVAFALDRAMLLPFVGIVFVAEIGSSLLQAIYKRIYGKRLFKLAPIHLHLQLKGWSEEKVVMRLWLCGFVAAFLGLWLAFA